MKSKKMVSVFLVVLMLTTLVCVSASARTYSAGNMHQGVVCTVNYLSSVSGTASSEKKDTNIKISCKMQYWYTNLGGGSSKAWAYGSQKSGKGKVNASVSVFAAEVYSGYASATIGNTSYNNVGGTWL